MNRRRPAQRFRICAGDGILPHDPSHRIAADRYPRLAQHFRRPELRRPGRVGAQVVVQVVL